MIPFYGFCVQFYFKTWFKFEYNSVHVNKLLHKKYNLQDDVYKPTSNLWGKNHISHQDFFFLYLFWGLVVSFRPSLWQRWGRHSVLLSICLVLDCEPYTVCVTWEELSRGSRLRCQFLTCTPAGSLVIMVFREHAFSCFWTASKAFTRSSFWCPFLVLLCSVWNSCLHLACTKANDFSPIL